MANLTAPIYDKMSVDESFKCKRKDFKVAYKLKLDNEDKYTDSRTITKVLKLEESNQYYHAMTKQLPTGCIKEKMHQLGKNLIFHLKKYHSKIK